MKDYHNFIKVIGQYADQRAQGNATTQLLGDTGVAVNLYRGCEVLLTVSAADLSAANAGVTVGIEHSDTAVAADFAAVPDNMILGNSDDKADGVATKIGGNRAGATAHRFGYIGDKDRVRVTFKGGAGTPALEIGCLAVGMDALDQPTKGDA